METTQARLAFSSIQPPQVLITKNISSNYLRTENSYFLSAGGHRGPNKRPPHDRVLVIHPGSRWLRLGIASDLSPIYIPHILARRNSLEGSSKSNPPERHYSTPTNALLAEALAASDLDIQTRLSIAKRKPVSNARQLCVQYNTSSQAQTPEIIRDHAEAKFTHPWRNRPSSDLLFGNDALHIYGSDHGYKIRWPIYRRKLNRADYSSMREIQGDLYALWKWAITSQLRISSLKDYHVVLIIPDAFDREDVLVYMDTLHELGFSGYMLMQESMAISFGAGASSALVIDLGSTCTTLACVDEGFIVGPRLELPYGGDDVTRYLSFLLKHHAQAPYPFEIDEKYWEWKVAEEIKEAYATLNEVDINFNVISFYARSPENVRDGVVEKWTMKIYDEAVAASSIMFVESALKYLKNTDAHFKRNQCLYNEKGEKHVKSEEIPVIYPPTLDRAIRDVTSDFSSDRQKRIFSFVILSGGAAKTPGLADYLTERIRQLPGFQALDRQLRVITGAKEMDPRAMAWKGGCVASKIDCAGEMWCARAEWQAAGLRALLDKITFVW